MSAKRKLKRSGKTRKADSGASPEKQVLRRQTSQERFKKPGSDKLWEVLLGWNELRLRRIWLVQSVHDVSSKSPHEPAQALLDALPALLRDHRGSLDPAAVARVISAWSSDSHDFEPRAPGPKWHVLASFMDQLSWGAVTPESLQSDWETWTNLGLAGKPRTILMQLLQQTERASLDLDQLTASDNIQAIANVSRALWFAVAYGDQATFEKIRSWSAQFSPKLPGSS